MDNKLYRGLMKKLLFLLFPVFIGLKSFSQFSLNGSSRAFVNNATLSISSQLYTAGHVYVFFINTSASGVNPTDNPTVSSGSLTLVKQTTVAGGNRRIIIYTVTPSSNATTAITFTFAETQLNHLYAIYESSTFVGNTINTQTGGTTGTDPTLTVGVTSNAYTIGYFYNDVNPFGGTAETDWTEDVDGGLGTPAGQYAVHRNSTTDNTILVTAASSNWIGVAIQFSGRRAVIIN
jgi:hypothetical protein